MAFPCTEALGRPSWHFCPSFVFIPAHLHWSTHPPFMSMWQTQRMKKKKTERKKEEHFWHRSNSSNTWQGFISCDFWCSHICRLEETLSWFETRIHMGIGFLSSMMSQTTNLVWVSGWVKPPYVHSVMRPLLELTLNQQGSYTVVIFKHQGYRCPEGDLYLLKNVCETLPPRSFHLIRLYWMPFCGQAYAFI